jgi:hypothetical protein
VINGGALYQDASGALWLGMRSTGVDRLAGGAERFTTYRHVSQDPKSPSSNVVTALAVGSAGALWIGTEAGLDRFDGQRFTHYVADPRDPGKLSPGPEREVALDSHGAVWTGTYGGGLDRLDGQQVRHFRHDPKNSDSPANNDIGSLVPDAHGGLWIGVHGDGLDYFDGRHFTHFPPEPGNPAALQDGWVLPLLLDPRGMLWIAIVDLVGKGNHVRTVPMPIWVKSTVDRWMAAATVADGRVFRAVSRHGTSWGRGISENVVWYVVRSCAQRIELDHLAPHDLRRTCAKLCHVNGGFPPIAVFLVAVDKWSDGTPGPSM